MRYWFIIKGFSLTATCQRPTLLNTLAQSGTANSDIVNQSPEIVVNGLGSDIADRDALKRRVKRKTITQKLALALVTVAELNNDPTRRKQYWNCYNCQKQVVTANGRVYSKFCKSRFCLVCQSIRKAEIINRYMPIIKAWEDPHFVTLTVKSVTQAHLPGLLKAMQEVFTRITGRYRKQNQRGKGYKLVGIRSLEINFNPVAKSYNPHYHLLVKDEAMAEILVKEWLASWPSHVASPLAQNIQKTGNLERVLIEIVKYSSKIFVQPDMNKRKDSKVPRMVYAAALDHIFTCLGKYRVFERFGFDLPPVVKIHAQTRINLDQCENWVFHPALSDWYKEETGEVMSGFVPPPQLGFFLSQVIDKDLK